MNIQISEENLNRLRAMDQSGQGLQVHEFLDMLEIPDALVQMMLERLLKR